MKPTKGQFVFLRHGAGLEVVTFMRLAEASKSDAAVAIDTPNEAQRYTPPGATAYIKRKDRHHEELVMLEDIRLIPSQATALHS